MPSTSPPRGRYELQAELGRGGMGVVHAAFDRLRNEEVALKRLLVDRFRSAADRARATTLFEREYHTLSQLEHPHIVRVFDYGVDALGPFYTMERLRGACLRDSAPQPWAAAARTVRDIASALAIVHARRLVHRDVTPRNIHLDADGGAKLIDFGAMIPAGIAKQIVGTPAFMAPECLRLQPLDGQTDLFALGACLYFALSGRNAFPAQNLEMLETIWQTAPPSLARLVPDLPDEMEALVMSLLSLAPAGRPRTAADVYERLTSIADLPRSEHGQVARAYLTTPALVGRVSELAALRERGRHAAAGRGSSVLLDGQPGVGRTRLLDAALLEARLLGLRIARADASDAQAGPLGVVSRLLQSLAADGVHVDVHLERRALSAVKHGDVAELLVESARERTLRDLSEVFLAIASEKPLAIGIDDLHLLDDSSLAVIASLSVLARPHPLLLLSTLDSTVAAARPSNALRLLRESSKRLAVSALEPDQTRAMLSAIFGEVPNLDLLSTIMHARYAGSPRLLMDAARATLAAGLVAYEGGAWVISSDPAAIARALDARTDVTQLLAALSSDALELLEVLSLDRDGVMSLSDYAALTQHGDSGRMHRALSELIEAQWLDMAGDRTRFRRSDQKKCVADNIAPERAREMHARLAERCARPELPPVYTAHHFVRAGVPERAIRPMEAMTHFAENNGGSDVLRLPIVLDTLEAFGRLANAPGAHPNAQANYAAGFVTNAVLQGLPERAKPAIADALAQMAPFTGVADYLELAQLPDQERLMQALARADARCKPAGIGGLDVVRMIRRQTQLSLSAAICSYFLAEPALLSVLPDWKPFAILSPALAIADRLIDGIGKLVRGQSWIAWDVFKQADAQLEALPDGALDSLTSTALRLAVLGYQCALESEYATPSALARLDAYAARLPHNAESLRARYFYAIGDISQSLATRKKSELLSVQSNSLPETRNTEMFAYLSMYALSDDLLRLRHVHAHVVELAKTRPGWAFRPALARAHMLRCRGKFDQALAMLVPPLRQLPDDHGDFVPGAALHLELLNAARRYDEALSLGNVYLERAKLRQVPEFRIELPLARTHAELGQHEWAAARFNSALHALESRNVRGLLLGRAYEVGARVAMAKRDAATFAERAKACAVHCAVHENAALAASYAKLLRDAQRCGVMASDDELSVASGEGAMGAAIRELAAVTNDTDFYAKALALVVEFAGASGGYLYARTPDGLRRVAHTGGLACPDSIDPDAEAARHFERASTMNDRTLTSLSAPDPADLAPARWSGDSELILWPYVLPRQQKGAVSIEGVVLLAMTPYTISNVTSASLGPLATLMTSRGDEHTTTHDRG